MADKGTEWPTQTVLMTLTLDEIDPSGLTAVVSYYVQSDTTYENPLDSMDIRFVGDTSTVIYRYLEIVGTGSHRYGWVVGLPLLQTSHRR